MLKYRRVQSDFRYCASRNTAHRAHVTSFYCPFSWARYLDAVIYHFDAADCYPNALGAIHQSGVMREVEDITNSGVQLSLLSRSIIRDIRSRLKAADKDWQLDLLAWQRVSHSVLPEGVLIVCNERDGELVDINTAWYYREKERWLETGNDHVLLSKKRFGFFINPENMPPSDSSDWLVFDKLNPPAGLVLAAIESYDCGWVYQMAYYRDGQWYHPCTQQDTRAHMPFTHYIPASRLPDLWV